VTLYRGEAQITRLIPLKGKKGTMEFVVHGLPEKIVSSSLVAEGENGVLIRAVRYKRRLVRHAPRKEVRVIDTKLSGLGEKLRQLRQTLQILRKQLQYLQRLEGFVTPSAKAGLMKGTFDPKKLIQMTSYLFQQREKLMLRIGGLKKRTKSLRHERRQLKYQRAQLTASAAHYEREAIVFLEKSDAKEASFRLTYRVGGCGWSPMYTVRGDAKKKFVDLEYSALIRQASGEDWKDVKLQLSTAQPSLSATAPGLAPFQVRLVSGAMGRRQQHSLLRRYKRIRRRYRDAQLRYNNVQSLHGNEIHSWSLNKSAKKSQIFELNYKQSTLSWLNKQMNKKQQPALDYHLTTPQTLPSRGEKQMLRIMRKRLKASFFYLASPVLTNFIHREAEIVNNSPYALLAGPVAVYLHHRFVGRTELPTISKGERFSLGFGADPTLRTTRKLINKTVHREGGNRMLAFVYRLKIENYRGESLPVRLFDRIPYVGSGSHASIKLTSISQPLSKDKMYLQLERNKGILRWDTSVKGNAHGKKATTIEYSYTMTFDRQYHLEGVNNQKTRMQFFKQQRRRWRR
tara:strand:- start:5330 stop:7039 length:1710 start_codon:yes stop_codon:yes gene_type:complete